MIKVFYAEYSNALDNFFSFVHRPSVYDGNSTSDSEHYLKNVCTNLLFNPFLAGLCSSY